jgi:flagellum-specific peptidoglycan hydrolase FlgJ
MKNSILIFFIFYTLLMGIKFIGYLSYSSQEEKRSLVDEYVKKYSGLAITEMYCTGFPASIKLAQGILESKSGESELSVKANNHFGIKCSRGEEDKFFINTKEWSSSRKKMLTQKDCFKKFRNVAQCYRYHSKIFKSGYRYQKLFDNSMYDYQSWALGLKKYGYATDPKYSKKIICLIEKYKLYQMDVIPVFLFI